MTEPNRQSGENEERIIEIEIERLRPFKEHPFQVKDDSDSEMNDNKSNHIISVDEKRYDSDNRSEDYQACENLVKETIDEEFKTMKTHSELGAAIIKDMDFPQDHPLVHTTWEICRWYRLPMFMMHLQVKDVIRKHLIMIQQFK